MSRTVIHFYGQKALICLILLINNQGFLSLSWMVLMNLLISKSPLKVFNLTVYINKLLHYCHDWEYWDPVHTVKSSHIFFTLYK